MQKDNLVHFMPIDLNITSEIGLTLLKKNFFSLEHLKNTDVHLGEAMTYSTAYFIWSLEKHQI